MPEAIAASLALAVPELGATVVGTITAAQVVTYTALVAGSIGVNRLLQGETATPASSVQFVIRQPLPSRKRSYGKVKVAGALAFEQQDVSKNFWLVQLIGQGEIAAVDEYWLGDDQVLLGAAILPPLQVIVGNLPDTLPYMSVPYGLAAVMAAQLGAANQFPPAALVSAFPGDYTNDFRWQGVPTLIVGFLPPSTLTAAQKLFPYGPPNARTVQRSAMVYDPRASGQVADGDPDRPRVNGWAYTQNAACVILDYLRHPDGWARAVTGAGARRMTPIAQFNVASFAAFAAICDQAVPVVGGGTVPRYQLAGTYDMTVPPKDVLDGMLAACDGELYRDGAGLVAIRGGAWGPDPTVVIADGDIIEHSLKPGASKFSACNRVNAKYTSARNDYQQVAMDPWLDQANIDLRGEELVADLDLTWAPTHSQARRVAKINIAKRNPAWSGTVVTGPRGLLAFAERLIELQVSELGISSSFLVTGFRPTATLERVELTVAALNASAYQWDDSQDGVMPPLGASAQSTVYVRTPLLPFAIIVFDVSLNIYRAILTWQDPTGGALTYFYEAQFTSSIGSGAYAEMDVVDGLLQARTSALTPLDPAQAQNYFFRVRSVTPSGKASGWTTAVQGTFNPPSLNYSRPANSYYLLLLQI